MDFDLIVAVAGSRVGSPQQSLAVQGALDRINPDVVVHGGCSGADEAAHRWCKAHGRRARVFFPDWNSHRASAGPIRNRAMLEGGGAKLLLAFPGGAGTKNCVETARNLGIEVRMVEVPE